MTRLADQFLEIVHADVHSFPLSQAQHDVLTALLPQLIWPDDEFDPTDLRIRDLDYLDALVAEADLLPPEIWHCAESPTRLALVTALPDCELCASGEATFDAPVPFLDGRWGYLCEDCWTAHCVPELGASRGQRLATSESTPAWVTALCQACSPGE